MVTKYGKKKRRQNYLIQTVIAAVLISAVFLTTVSYFYISAEKEAYDVLHTQTKQIKDDLILQIKSDRENLITMANFAAKLYADGDDYQLMFDSFKPIGLFANIGILNPDNTFVTRVGSVDLTGKISFEEEAARGEYISGRVEDLTGQDLELIRSAVPIRSGDEVVGVLYGVINLKTIGDKYIRMAKELDAQLFVYDKENGKFVIDTINENPGELSQFETREYNDGYTYDDFINNDKGFSSFKSIFSGEDLYVHYSTIEDFDWGIMLARYESQVFGETHEISRILLVSFFVMALIIVLFILFVLSSEKKQSKTTTYASNIRKLLLEINNQSRNVPETLKMVSEFSNSKASFFIDTDGEEFMHISPEWRNSTFAQSEKAFLAGELFRCAVGLGRNGKATVGTMSIVRNKYLEKKNKGLYDLLKQHNIKSLTFASVTEKNNHVSVLGVVNSTKNDMARILLEDIAICFSISIYNKKHLNRTEIAATTDSLTGVLNRVSYKKDIMALDEEKPSMFSCIYIDVNELHIRNNKYGHAAGDEMLIYIANTLKEVFFGHKVYRMGGDEFLVFAKNENQDNIKKNIEIFVEQLKVRGYNVAIGTSYRSRNVNCEELVREAEIRMYEAKARYYQNKEMNDTSSVNECSYLQTKTGIREIDTMISVLQEHYNGIYRVSLKTDKAHRILMPAYLGYNENEEHFSSLLTKYINDIVHPDSHRAFTSLLNYDAIRRHLSEGMTPRISYKKVNGESMILTVYEIKDSTDISEETLWVFARE